MSQKSKGKWSRQDAFADKNKAEAEIFATLTADKHARKMAEHTQRMVELEIKKQQIDLEANEKRLDAEDHQITAQHQSEHEKEQHAMQMLHLQLQYQGASGVSGHAAPPQFGMEPFTDLDVFGRLGTDSNFSGLHM